MANKKLKVGGSSELRLPTKKAKGEKKPKWQAKTGGKKKGKESMVETPLAVQEEQALPPEPTETPDVATTTEAGAMSKPRRTRR
ncbi:MAG: hypothetical protein JNJ77_05205 [Planctomycetia bacterium]|nr:hypothetical protein [Planctomycetia bacterium]